MSLWSTVTFNVLSLLQLMLAIVNPVIYHLGYLDWQFDYEIDLRVVLNHDRSLKAINKLKDGEQFKIESIALPQLAK